MVHVWLGGVFGPCMCCIMVYPVHARPWCTCGWVASTACACAASWSIPCLEGKGRAGRPWTPRSRLRLHHWSRPQDVPSRFGGKACSTSPPWRWRTRTKDGCTWPRWPNTPNASKVRIPTRPSGGGGRPRDETVQGKGQMTDSWRCLWRTTCLA